MLPPAAPVAACVAHIKHSPTQITSESPASLFSSDCFLLFACFQFFWVEKSESGLKSEEKKWKWIEICVRRWVRHVFSLGCSHRRQNGTILGKFRWKTKTSCFDAKLVLTQPALRQFKSAGGLEPAAMLKTRCFARRGVQQQQSLVDSFKQRF